MSNEPIDLFEKGYRNYIDLIENVDNFTPIYSAFIANKYGTAYVQNVQKAVDAFNEAFKGRTYKGSIRQNWSIRGFAAEDWHTHTFNYDAAIKDIDVKATANHEQGFGSIDITTSDGGKYSLKYYNNGVASVDAQAEDLYKSLGLDEKTQDERQQILRKYKDILKRYGLDENATDEQLKSTLKYEGQELLIPAGQETQGFEHLEEEIAKDRSTPGNEPYAKGKQKAKKRICTTVKSKDGKVSSKQLTKEDADKLADKAKKGEVRGSDYGISTESVPYKYILKKSCKIGVNAAITAAAISIMTNTIRTLMNEGFSFDDFKRMCEDGVLSGAGAYLQGSISAGVSISCELGKFGEFLKSSYVSASYTAAAITAIAVHTMRNAYEVAMGRKKSAELANELISDVFISAGSLAGGILTAFAPIPFVGYFIGSAIGGMLASFVYKKAYTATIGLCIENGYTLWGLVKQDYTLPANVLRELGFDVAALEQSEIEIGIFEHSNIDRPQYDRPQYDISKDYSLNIGFLRRGVIGVNEIGYVF